MSDLGFQLMVHVGMPIRNLFMPPNQMLAEVDTKPGYRVLDFGCGPGFFTTILAERVRPSGTVHALDVHPFAIKMVEKKARKKRLSNVKTILSNCSTDLPDNSLDLIIFFDVLHVLDSPEDVLRELHRVLKPEAVMSFSDHHMKDPKILSEFVENGMFMLLDTGKRTSTYSKVKGRPVVLGKNLGG